MESSNRFDRVGIKGEKFSKLRRQREGLYNAVTRMISDAPASALLIVGGYFNAEPGVRREGEVRNE